MLVGLSPCSKGRFCQNDVNIDWNIVPCLMWCIWKEMNSQSFEDCKKTSLELQLCFLKSLFEWNYSLLMPFSIFLALYIFVLSFLVLDLAGCFSFVYVICTWDAPVVLLMNLFYLSKKKKVAFCLC